MVFENGNQEIFRHAAVVSTKTYFRKPPKTCPEKLLEIVIELQTPGRNGHEGHTKRWRGDLNEVISVRRKVEPKLILKDQTSSHRFDFSYVALDWPEETPGQVYSHMIVQVSPYPLFGESLELLGIVLFCKACCLTFSTSPLKSYDGKQTYPV